MVPRAAGEPPFQHGGAPPPQDDSDAGSGFGASVDDTSEADEATYYAALQHRGLEGVFADAVHPRVGDGWTPRKEYDLGRMMGVASVAFGLHRHVRVSGDLALSPPT